MDEARLAAIEAALADGCSVLPLAVHDGCEDEEYEDGSGGWVTEHHPYHALRGRCRADDAMTPGSYEVGRVHSAAAGRRIATLANAAPALVAEVRRLRARTHELQEAHDRKYAALERETAHWQRTLARADALLAEPGVAAHSAIVRAAMARLLQENERLQAALAPILAAWDREAAGCDCRSAATVLRREWMDAARATLDSTGPD